MQEKFIKIKKGLDIPLVGASERQVIDYQADTVAISPLDFNYSTPKMLVSVGDAVCVGTPLFYLQENPDVRIVSPVSGSVAEIRRGEKRRIEQIVLANDGRFEQTPLYIAFGSRSEIVETLQQSGLWAFIRQRPFDQVADPRRAPKAIFVNTFDSAPLAPDFAFLLEDAEYEFCKGLEILARLTDGTTYLSLRQDADNQLFMAAPDNVQRCYFSGPHPAGEVGTQIHHIAPLNADEVVWHLNAWQVVAIGKLFLHGKLDFHRRIAFCGAALDSPHYVRLCCGAAVAGLGNEALHSSRFRWISGNVLTGKNIGGSGFLAFYDHQITVIEEGGEGEILGWLRPSPNKWSFSHTFLAWLFPKKRFTPQTALRGGVRSIMMPEVYDAVFPFDILPVELLKACQICDFELMEQLGIFELTAADFALCEVVCPSKIAWQQIIGDAIGELLIVLSAEC